MLVEGTGAIQLGKSNVWKKLSERTSSNNFQMLLVSSPLILVSSVTWNITEMGAQNLKSCICAERQRYILVLAFVIAGFYDVDKMAL